MAPIKSRSKSTSTRSPSSYPSIDSTFASTKKDKRIIKHSSLLSKIQKSSAKPLKRRRPSKKLTTTLDSLADALPSISSASTSSEQGAKASQARREKTGKSLKTRPGSMKRKVEIERKERERMGLNMAQLAKADAGAQGGSLEALRRHLKERMEGGG